jgi:hypothetical protein
MPLDSPPCPRNPPPHHFDYCLFSKVRRGHTMTGLIFFLCISHRYICASLAIDFQCFWRWMPSDERPFRATLSPRSSGCHTACSGRVTISNDQIKSQLPSSAYCLQQGLRMSNSRYRRYAVDAGAGMREEGGGGETPHGLHDDGDGSCSHMASRRADFGPEKVTKANRTHIRNPTRMS